MAEYLASIFGTEKDKVNCSFYFKIGACRHGERCSRIHNKPTFSQTLLLQNLYQNPQNVTQSLDPLGKETQITRVHTMSDEEAQEHFDDFFEDVFVELEDKYGEIEEMNVCDNLGDHLVGNVYVKFRREEDAERASIELNNRWFGGRPILAELSPVTDFREACCRQYEMGECTRSGFCNFMHLKPISRELRRELYGRRRAAALERRIASYIGGDGPTRSRSVERRPRSRDRDHRSDRGDRSNRGDRSDRSSRRSSKHADSKEERISSRSRRSRSRSHDSKHKSGGDSKSSSGHHRRHRDRESRHGGEGHRRGSRDQAAAAASSSHAEFNEQDEDNYGPQPGAAPPVHGSNSQDEGDDYYSNNHHNNNYQEEDDGRPHAQSQQEQQGYNYNDDDSNSYNGAGSQPPPPMNDNDSYNYRSGYQQQEDSNPRPMDDEDSNNQQQYHQNSNSNDEEDSRPMMAGGIYGSMID